MNRAEESLYLSMLQCRKHCYLEANRENLIKMQSIRSVRHRSQNAEKSSCFNALQTVGADAVIGSGESSRKHKYEIAVMQEGLGALWKQTEKGLQSISLQIRHKRDV